MDIIVESGDAFDLESVQQSHFGSRFVFWHFNLQIEMQIGAQMRRTVILPFETHFEHLKIEDCTAN